MSSIIIRLTKKQIEALSPLWEDVVKWSNEGRPGAILGNVQDTIDGLKYAGFIFLQHETVKKMNEVLKQDKAVSDESFSGVRFSELHPAIKDALTYYSEGNWDGGKKASDIMSRLKK